jgi:threonine/homoserine/homoserine lactone efflux protein
MPETGLFLVASALLTIAPGPDIVYVLTRGVAQGRAAGIAAALGFATGCIFHTLLAALGIAALIRSSELAFDLVRYAGAVYLAWIGIQALSHRAAFSMQGAGGAKGLGVIYRQSVLGNMMNPKVSSSSSRSCRSSWTPGRATRGCRWRSSARSSWCRPR